MKKTLNQIQIGQTITAIIEEVISPQNFIINFQGDLVRVSNQTTRKFSKGQQVELIVSSVKPLSFKIKKPRRRMGFEVRV